MSDGLAFIFFLARSMNSMNDIIFSIIFFRLLLSNGGSTSHGQSFLSRNLSSHPRLALKTLRVLSSQSGRISDALRLIIFLLTLKLRPLILKIHSIRVLSISSLVIFLPAPSALFRRSSWVFITFSKSCFCLRHSRIRFVSTCKITRTLNSGSLASAYIAT